MSNNDFRDSVIALAEQEIGTTEMPSGSNVVKYNDWYYNEGHTYFKNSAPFAWCGTFCSYVYFFAGRCMPKIDTDLGFHYVPTLFHKAKSLRWETTTPQKGDLVIFDFKQDKVIDHVGIFAEWVEKGVSFNCIEGNTSSSEKGSQSNGGGVFKRKRSVRDVIQYVNLIDNVKE